METRRQREGEGEACLSEWSWRVVLTIFGLGLTESGNQHWYALRIPVAYREERRERRVCMANEMGDDLGRSQASVVVKMQAFFVLESDESEVDPATISNVIDCTLRRRQLIGYMDSKIRSHSLPSGVRRTTSL